MHENEIFQSHKLHENKIFHALNCTKTRFFHSFAKGGSRNSSGSSSSRSSNGLPSISIPHGGLAFGFMPMEKETAALTAELYSQALTLLGLSYPYRYSRSRRVRRFLKYECRDLW